MKFIELNSTFIRQFSPKFEKFFSDNIADYEFFHPHEFTVTALLAEVSSKPRDLFMVLTGENNNIIGYGMLRGWSEGYDIPSLGIMIDKRERGKGYSSEIMKTLHSIAKSRGATQVRLTVLKQNTSAISLYNNFGYQLEELDSDNLIGYKQL